MGLRVRRVCGAVNKLGVRACHAGRRMTDPANIGRNLRRKDATAAASVSTRQDCRRSGENPILMTDIRTGTAGRGASGFRPRAGGEAVSARMEQNSDARRSRVMISAPRSDSLKAMRRALSAAILMIGLAGGFAQE